MGRFSNRIYTAYTTFFILGLVLSMQIPFVGEFIVNRIISLFLITILFIFIFIIFFFVFYKVSNLFEQVNTWRRWVSLR
jgi:dolichyl-diphosphooligosaccharide--protein glycosyltransferase